MYLLIYLGKITRKKKEQKKKEKRKKKNDKSDDGCEWVVWISKIVVLKG